VTTSSDLNNNVAIINATTTVFNSLIEYVGQLRKVQIFTRKEIRRVADSDLMAATTDLYMSIFFLCVAIIVGPLIVMFNRKLAMAGEVGHAFVSWPNQILLLIFLLQIFLKGMADSTRNIKFEQMKAQRLLVKLLPRSVVAKLKNQAVCLCNKIAVYLFVLK